MSARQVVSAIAYLVSMASAMAATLAVAPNKPLIAADPRMDSPDVKMECDSGICRVVP